MAFAQQTLVPVEKSKHEIEVMLAKAGATGFGYMAQDNKAMLAFTFHSFGYKILFDLPKKDEFAHTPGRQHRVRHPDDVYRFWEQACRSRWRAMALIIKAKLEAVEIGLTSIEKEFAGDMVMGDGQTVYDHLRTAIVGGKVPKALPFFGGEDERRNR